ncbi:zinc finger protein 652-like isoform X1 [Lucilia cuprina]|uniref:zinc finger protein 652-like isoform X1 n=1 Tax=Lucilia cuprina TaxID=7375 RepID=UPI001F051F82|nr:zinc finger protein 652-like isoform X1 [Lucilia cuprina]
MGANKNSDLQKCGELLIDIEKIKYKTKSYTYRCAFCNIDCEQLKKFTKHLEDEHFLNFDDLLKNDPVKIESESSNLSSDPEDLKVDQQMYIVNTDSNAVTTKNPIDINVHCDPLSMMKTETNDDLVDNDTKKDVRKIEKIDNVMPDLETNENASFDEQDSEDCYVMGFDDCNRQTDGNNTSNCKFKRNYKKTKIKQRNSDVSDQTTSVSDDVDFYIEKETITKKKSMNFNKEIKKPKPRKEPKKELVEDNEKPSSWRIYKQFLPLFIEQYKKYEELWKVDNIAFGVKPVRYDILGKIAEEIKLDLKRNISAQGVHKHIMYLNRLYSKDKKQELICKIENKKFTAESDLYTELSSFLKECQGPFICSICNEMISKYDPYCLHLAEHNGTKPFKCTSCGMTFSKLHKYKIHKKRHLGVYNHQCNVCGKGYLFQAELNDHLTSHTGLKSFLCSICGESFKRRQYYANHMLRHENRFRHECYICKKGFLYTQALKAHIKSHLKLNVTKCLI